MSRTLDYFFHRVIRTNIGAGSTPFVWMCVSFASLVSIVSTLTIVALVSIRDTVDELDERDPIVVAAATTPGGRVRRDVNSAYRRTFSVNRDDAALSSLALNVGTSHLVERAKA